MDPQSDAGVIAASLVEPGRFGALFDRHATTLFRYFVRRVGPDEADTMLGELFRIAFERRESFDLSRAEARPWLYGIATNLLSKHRRREARRIHATARLVSRGERAHDAIDELAAKVDAGDLWPRVAEAVASLPEGERDALLLYAWEDLSYAEIAAALDVPIGTVRSRLNRVRSRLRELDPRSGEEQATTTLQPDHVIPVDAGDPGVFKREKENLMSMIDESTPKTVDAQHTPTMYPRLAYRDEVAALEYLTRVFQSRMGGTENEGMLAWLEFGSGVVMIGRASEGAHTVHHLYSPSEVAHTTVVINVSVHDIDAHYAHSLSQGATITMPIEDAFYGFRRYEADDLEGHHWHFNESFAAIRARGGTVADDA
jgi:RNA polymerase sigma-70 factor (ECF subfamily)